MLINDIGNKLYEKLFTSFTEQCTVPAYIIHQSEDSDDYLVYFQVEAITERLKHGVFVRPTIEVWSGRSDVDRSGLAKALRLAFIDALEKDKQQQSDVHDECRKGVVADGEKAKSKLISKVSWLGSAIAAALFVSNPITNAVILFIAVTSGKSAMTEAIKLLRLSVSSLSTGKANTDRALEQAIQNKQGAVDEALEHIDIKLHPFLYKSAHNNFDIAATPATGIVINAAPLPTYIESLAVKKP